VLGALALTTAAGSCCPDVRRDDGSSGTSGDGGPVGGASLSLIQKELFDRNCVSACHEAVNAAADLRLSPGESYQNLVNVPSQQITSQVRVVPGEADKSYLVKKLEGGVGMVGDQMPRLAPPRPQSEIDWVRTWITRGAPND
jgi:hypothetical protein